MCIAIPAKITSIFGQKAQVQSGLLSAEVLLAFANAQINQWVIVQSGIALAEIDEEEARQRLEILKMMRAAKMDANFTT